MDLVGQRFERLVVLAKAEPKGKTPYRWLCKCDCGKEKTVAQGSLTRGLTRSCGCIQKEFTINRQLKHGMCYTKVYFAWQDMKKRCSLKTHKCYPNYGGRGITVCDSWKHSFESFYSDMGDLPFEGAEIDRIDNNKGYSPENCRWVTVAENLRNRSDNVVYTYNGKTMCETDWAAEVGIPRSTLYARRKRGWSVEDMLTKPLRSAA